MRQPHSGTPRPQSRPGDGFLIRTTPGPAEAKRLVRLIICMSYVSGIVTHLKKPIPLQGARIESVDMDEYGFSKTRGWSTGLLECSTIGDVGIAGFVFCCEPCSVGLLARNLPGGTHPLAERPATATFAYMFGVGCCACGHTKSSFRGPMHYSMRMQLRKSLNIEGDPWHDLMLTTFCPQLALCQV